MDQAQIATASRCRSGRAATFVAGLATLIMAASTVPERASAQQNNSTTGFAPAPVDRPPSNTLDPQPRLQAPIGHRQPRPSDLPPGMARDEGARTPAERELDEKLQICRGC
jgi:hypothetical protein